MKRYKQHETTKMTIPPKFPGCLHPLGSQEGGGGHPDPKIGVGGVVFFRSFRPQFGPTIRGAWGAPGSVTDN